MFRFFVKNEFCDLKFKILRPDTSEPPPRLQLKNVSISSVFHCFFKIFKGPGVPGTPNPDV